MKKIDFTCVFIGVSLMITSCVSEDTVIGESSANNEIKFNVTNNHVTRAKRYSQASDINKFKVSAVLQGSGVYFANESISRDGNEPWKYDSGTTRYWPSKGNKLNFFALAPASPYEISLAGQSASISGVEQKEMSGMEDLIVAYTFDQEVGDAKDSKKVELNFSHALAQVAIAAKVPSTLKVEVEEVAIVNINAKANYSYPTSSTGSANWTKVGEEKALVSYTIDDNKVVEYKDDNTFTPLVPTTDAFLVLPFGYTTATNKTGTCIKIKCKMYNVEGGNESLVFDDNGAAKNLYIPVPINWQMGKRYIYNLAFGSGTAGFDDENNSSLVKIDWDVKYKDWEGDGNSEGNGDGQDDEEDWIQINPGEQTV